MKIASADQAARDGDPAARQLAAELGFVMPAVRIVDNVQLEANHYFIKIKEIDAGHGIVYAGQFMAMDPMGGSVNLPGNPPDPSKPTDPFGVDVKTWMLKPLM